jgi:hypothetical protein
VIYTGDSKAEENSWNASLMQIAISMMPAHPNISTWKSKCSELMVSAYARPSDVNRTATVDGKTLTSWLNGSNAEENGSLINHDLIHDDYMAAIEFNLRSYLAFSLAEITIPQSAAFNSAIVYDALVDLNFSSPPYQSPGGTMYERLRNTFIIPLTGADIVSIFSMVWTRLRLLDLTPLRAHADSHGRG